MATISTRLDDSLKAEAEVIADEIGITLSSVINIFLKQFIAHRGFPFSVVAPNTNSEHRPVIDITALETAVKMAIADTNNSGKPKEFTFLDPNTNKLTKISTGEE